MPSKSSKIRNKVIAYGRKKVIHKVSSEGFMKWLKDLGVDIEDKNLISTDRNFLNKLISDYDEYIRKEAIQKFKCKRIKLVAREDK